MVDVPQPLWRLSRELDRPGEPKGGINAYAHEQHDQPNHDLFANSLEVSSNCHVAPLPAKLTSKIPDEGAVPQSGKSLTVQTRNNHQRGLCVVP